jgi:hypothetical protein
MTAPHRIAIAIAFLSACATREVSLRPDAKVDARAEYTAREWIEPSPKDETLQFGVFALSLVVAFVPIGARQRRRNTL